MIRSTSASIDGPRSLLLRRPSARSSLTALPQAPLPPRLDHRGLEHWQARWPHCDEGRRAWAARAACRRSGGAARRPSSRAPRPRRDTGADGANAASPVTGALRFHGHAVWQRSQPNCHSPIRDPSSALVSPRCSMVRYEMHRRASSTYGATKASHGQVLGTGAARNRSDPGATHRARARRWSAAPRLRGTTRDPARSSIVFLPIQPRPARVERSRSSTGPVSTYPRLPRPPACLFEIGAEPAEPGGDHVVIVAAPGVTRHGRPRRISDVSPW